MSAAVVHRVLVLSDEPVVAALVGILVEIAGRTPVFAEPVESATDALERLRPLSVVLVEVTLGSARSDLFFAAAAKSGIGVAVFGPVERAREIAEIAGSRNVPWFTMPPSREQLATALDIAGGRARRRRDTERRAGVEAVIASDGTRILLDRDGRRWMVYDRRVSSDRRREEEPATVRVFVSDAGEARQCGLDESEARQASAIALELQLSRSLPA